MDNVEENPLVIVDAIQRNIDWLNQWDGYLQDKEFEECLNKVLKIVAKPNVPQPKVATLCVQLSAYATIFRMRSVEFMAWRKGVDGANARKNSYIALYHGIDNLVASLKYLIRE